MLRVSTCLVVIGLSATLAQAQGIPPSYHGIWAGEDCEHGNSHIIISAREMNSLTSTCVAQPGTVRLRPSGISFQFKCTEAGQQGAANGFTVLEFETGYKKTVLIQTIFVEGITDRKTIRPAALGRCIYDKRKGGYRFAGEEYLPNHWLAYEPQRAARLLSGERPFDARPLRKDGTCENEFCASHNEAERCNFDNEKRLRCSVLYTENAGTKLVRAWVDPQSGSITEHSCIGNCHGQQRRRMTPADIDTDTEERGEESD